jgi:hypothetical protein
MSSRVAIGRNAPALSTFVGLCLIGLLAASCSSAPARGGNGNEETDTGGKSGGATGGKSGGTGGAEPTGGAGGSATGGSSGGDTGGVTGTGGSVTPDAAVEEVDAAPPAADSAGPSADNPCFTKMIDNSRSLPGLSAKDFCDGYEKYCMYTPDGKLMSKCGPGQPVGPLYKDRADCETKYMAASASARACRAGQMCRNGKDGVAAGADTAKGMSLIINACSHATGYCAGACK